MSVLFNGILAINSKIFELVTDTNKYILLVIRECVTVAILEEDLTLKSSF